MCCRISLKVRMLHTHLDKYNRNTEAYSGGQRERFYRDVMDFERRNQGQYNENIMGDYV